MTYPKGTTEPKKSVASPVQTVADKDLSNPFMAVDLPKVQQTQGTVDFPTKQTKQTCPEQKEIWDTLGEPSGKYDYLVKYSSSAEQSSLDKGKEIMQDSQDPDDDIISINRLLSQIQKLQDTPEKSKRFPRQKKKAIKKKKEDTSEKEIKECQQDPSPEDSQPDDEEFGEEEHLGTNNSDSGMSFSPTAQHNLDT
ncbi:Uncharacterized protein Adt_31531 [Abeliophyllum distichum]|uniref:Uncharacterized protein n=1 Tax=Abeliophyllum distichum TaxID=126358 RepID=A0ABD1RED5_9LAMI